MFIKEGTLCRRALYNLITGLVLSGLFAPAIAENVSPKDDTTVTLTDLIDKLKGDGVTIDSPAFTAESNSQAGIFSDYSFLFGSKVNEGVVFSTGAAVDVVGANSADSTSTAINTVKQIHPVYEEVLDLVTLSFNVTPVENTLIVEYVFGSEEYNEYVGAGYNDFIRILVNGENCAVTANNLFVSIDAINNASNSFLYNDNDYSDYAPTFPYNTEMDGFTKLVSCRSQVTPGVSVPVVIAMADRGDANYDSWTFFRAHSLRSEPSNEFGDAPDTYQTLAASNGAAHTIVKGVYMGTLPDGDSDGFHDGIDDSAGEASDDAYDDGVLTFPALDADVTTSYSITVNATSINDRGATIIGWIDFDRDGVFQVDEASIPTSLATNAYHTNVTLSWPIIGGAGPDIVLGTSYARIRMVNNDEIILSGDYAGSKASGEVEDYSLQITGIGDVTASVVSIDTPPIATTSIVTAYPVTGSCTAGDDNVQVSITNASPASQSVVCSGGGRWSAYFDVSGIADGTDVIVINATQQDSRGNSGSAGPVLADKDVTAPTVAIQNAPAVVNNTGAITVTFEFSEDVTGFALVDIAVTNASKGNFVALDNNTYTADITPSAAGSITINVAAAVAQDGNNNNNTAASQVIIAYDAVVPVVTINAATTANAANASAYPVSGNCTAGDNNVSVTIGGATPETQAVACSGGGAWSASFDVSAIGDGTNAIVIDASQSDVAGNTGNATTQQQDKDADVPTVAIQNAPAIVNSTAAFSITLEFSENVSGFDVSDIAVVNGSAGNFAVVDGNTYTADITPAATGDMTIDIAMGAAQDSSANGNIVATQVIVAFDNVAPSVAISSAPVANAGNASTYGVSGSCSPGDGNVTVMIAGLTAQSVACTGAATWSTTFNVSSIADGANAITINASQTDAASNIGNAIQVQTDKDATAPTAASCTVAPNPANDGSALTATCTGVEAGGGVTIPNYTCGVESGGSVSCSATAGSGVGQVSGDATATTSDAVGNTATSTAAFTLDNTAPTAASCTVSPNPANDGTALTASCSGVESGGSVTIPNYTCGAESGGSVTCTATAGSGVGQVSGDATATTSDAAGNTVTSTAAFTLDNTAPTAASCTVAPNPANDGTALTATCTGVETGGGVTIPNYTCGAESGGSVTCTATAGSGVGQVSGDATATTSDAVGNTATSTAVFTLDNTAPTAASCTVAPNPANDGTALTASCSGVESGGSVTIPDYTCGVESGGSVTCTATAGSGVGQVSGDATATTSDAVGNTATSTAAFTLDNTAPTAASCTVAPNPANNGTALTASCSGVEAGGSVTIANYTCGAESGGSVSCSATAGSGVGQVSGDATATTSDAAGNTATSTAAFTLDNTVPTIDIQNEPATVNSTAAFTVRFEFSENVSGFDITDIAVVNATRSNFVIVDGNTYTADITPDGNGDITIDVAASAATDTAGNSSTAASQATTTFDNIDPVVSIDAPVPANAANAATYPVSGACTSDDGNVAVSISGATPAAQTVACSVSGGWSAVFNVTTIADGSNVLNINASQTDTAGNVGAATLTQADKDTVVPAVPSVNSQASSSSTPVISGSAVIGSGEVLTVAVNTVTYTDGDGNLAAGGGSWTLTIPGANAIPDGTHNVTARVSDAAGNISTDSTSNELVVDTVVPATPVVNSLLTNSTTPSISGTAAAVAGEVLTVQVNSVTYTDGDGNLSLASGNWTLNIPGANAITPDGIYNVTATLTDAAMNSSSDSTSAELEIDTADPVTPVVNVQTTNDATPVITGTAEADSAISVVVAGATYTTTATGGNWSIDTAGTPDSGSFNPDLNGTNSVFVTSTDAAGNTSSDITVDELTIDTTPPTVPTVNSQVTNTDAPTLTGTATLNSGEALTVTVNTVIYSVGDGNLSHSGSDWALVIPLANALADNTYEVTATVTDTATNASNDASSNELVVDTVAPAVPVVNVIVSNSSTPTLTGTATVGAGEILTVSVNAVTYSAGDGNLSLSGSNWSLVIPGTNAITPDGVYNVTATLTDAASNSSSDSSTAELTIDTTMLTPTIAPQVTSDATPILSGTAEANSTLTLVVGGATYTISAGAAGSWSLNTGVIAPDSGSFALVQGYNEVALTSTDAAGNSASDVTSNELYLTLDEDGDGIPNNLECPSGPPFDSSCLDTDNDGTPDFQDSDSDNDGIPDSVEAGNPNAPFDSDGDGTPDYRDTDSDGDGILDSVEGVTDSDGDGIPDYVDQPGGNDFDGDGIPDNVECPDYSAGCADTDGDGRPDYTDIDSDGDGINDSLEAGTYPTQPRDTDGDGTPDYQDSDSDNDGIADSVEGSSTDTDGDGIPDYVDADSAGPGAGDSDGDGIADNIECQLYPLCADSDGDGTPDYMEIDSDNDGINDAIEAHTSGNDADSDGIDDALDVNSTGGLDQNLDGIDDTRPLDSDGDGIPDYQDSDSDNDGVLDAVEGIIDSDGDGIPDYVDIASAGPGAGDSDADGILDDVECAAYPACADSDGDGIPDYLDNNDEDGPLGNIDGDGLPNYLDPDDDGDGILDLDEDSNLDGDNNPATNPRDTDADGIPDYQDIDSDGDGILDLVEGVVDTDGDGIPDYVDLASAGPGAGDSDGDGILDNVECPAYPACPDSDGDGQPDYMETDSDNDGISDAVERGALSSGNPVDSDGDGVPDYQDSDSDNDAITDAVEGTGDSDADGIPDYVDVDSSGAPFGGDSDGDGVEDAAECGNYPACIDSDNDNMPDYMDVDSRPYNPNDNVSTGLSGLGSNGPLTLLLLLVPLCRVLRRRQVKFLFVVVAVLSATVAGAAAFEKQWYFGLGLGVTELSPDTRNTGYKLADGGDSGLKLFGGYDYSPQLSVEGFYAELGTASLDNQGFVTLIPDGKIDYATLGVSALWYFWHQQNDQAYTSRQGWQSYLHGGLSLLNNSANVDFVKENSAQIHFGVGIEYGWNNGYAVRANIDSFDKDASLISINLLKRFGRKQTAVKDGDNDGVSNANDKCPATVTGRAVDALGCARLLDADSDGVADGIDQCPGTASAVKVDASGCANKQDPDADADGVFDALDQCPGTPRQIPVDVRGCTVFDTAALGINFESGSAKLTGQSKAILGELISTLLVLSEVKIEIHAYTDSQGASAYNKKLSQARATSVLDYLKAEGVENERMAAMGYGEEKPVADNATAAGRAKNRRVEFKVLSTAE